MINQHEQGLKSQSRLAASLSCDMLIGCDNEILVTGMEGLGSLDIRNNSSNRASGSSYSNNEASNTEDLEAKPSRAPFWYLLL